MSAIERLEALKSGELLNIEPWAMKPYIEALDCAIIALRDRAERKDAKPLTLEQMKERVGRAVWVVRAGGCLCRVLVSYVASRNPNAGYFVFDDCECLFLSDYEKGWLAYSSPCGKCLAQDYCYGGCTQVKDGREGHE